MERQIYKKLVKWKQSSRRKPLILRGARQVGKTYILQYFAKNEYENIIYLNFDEERHLSSLFEEDLNPERIIKELSIHFKKSILPEKTILVFDEIQECPNALNSLKYFCEKLNDYHIVTAGSLLGVKLNKGFPVGKVNFLDLQPLSFSEYLDAVGEGGLKQYLESKQDTEEINQFFHDKLTKLLKYYFVVGGMPEAVSTFIKTDDLNEVSVNHKEILDTYALDFAKHAPKEDMMKIMSIWNSLPAQLAKENKKFIYSAIRSSARARDYETSIQWLTDAGLIIKSYNISTPKLPLDAYADKRTFKLFCLDTGLLGAMSKLDPRVVLSGNQLFEEYKGALTENYVAQELNSNYRNDIYYWTSEGTAEVDFIISDYQKVYPLEVKAGTSKRKKSLLVYGEKYHKNNSNHILSRTTLRNFAHDGNIINYPLYAVWLFPNLGEFVTIQQNAE